MEQVRNLIVMRGAEATIRWGYHVAMRLAAWTFSGSGDEGGTFSATVVDRDAFRLTQQPLTLVLTVASSVDDILKQAPHLREVPWLKDITTTQAQTKWPVTAIAADDGTATITVGPIQRRA